MMNVLPWSGMGGLRLAQVGEPPVLLFSQPYNVRIYKYNTMIQNTTNQVQIILIIMINHIVRRRRGRVIRVLVSRGSSPLTCHLLDLFSVAPSSTPWLRSINGPLVCLLPVGIFKHLVSFHCG